MFRCSANCCDNTSLSQNEMQRCLENCSTPAMKADKFMQEQMQDMQVNDQLKYFFFFLKKEVTIT